jgi:hypothetical protein
MHLCIPKIYNQPDIPINTEFSPVFSCPSIQIMFDPGIRHAFAVSFVLSFLVKRSALSFLHFGIR